VPVVDSASNTPRAMARAVQSAAKAPSLARISIDTTAIAGTSCREREYRVAVLRCMHGAERSSQTILCHDGQPFGLVRGERCIGCDRDECGMGCRSQVPRKVGFQIVRMFRCNLSTQLVLLLKWPGPQDRGSGHNWRACRIHDRYGTHHIVVLAGQTMKHCPSRL